MPELKSIEHYLAERSEAKDIYNKHDRTHLAIKEKIERRAELIIGIKNAEQGLRKMDNPAFSDQITISVPSFRFQISPEFAKQELQRQLIEAKDELRLIDDRLGQVAAIFGMEV